MNVKEKVVEMVDETEAIKASHEDVIGNRKADAKLYVQELLPETEEKDNEVEDSCKGNKRRRGSGKKDETVQKAKKLQEMIYSEAAIVIDGDEDNYGGHADDEVIILNEEEADMGTASYSFPKIKTAAERIMSATAATDDFLKDIIGVGGNDDGKEPTQNQGDMIKMKTRLEKHERKWKIAKDGPFRKLKASVGGMYGVAAHHVILKFDGDKIDDDDTPRGIEIDNDDLIEVKFDKTCEISIEMAIANAKKQTTTSSAMNSSSTVHSQNNDSADIKVVVRIKHCLPNSEDKVSLVTVFGNRPCGEFLRKFSEKILKGNHSNYNYVLSSTGRTLYDDESFIQQGVVDDKTEIKLCLK